MANPSPVLVLNNLFELYKGDPRVFQQLPEFAFIIPLAEKIKAKGCMCGLRNEVAEATQTFNVIVKTLTPEAQQRMKTVLGRDPLIFGLQSPTGFESITY